MGEKDESGINEVSTTQDTANTLAQTAEDNPLLGIDLGMGDDIVTIYVIASVAVMCCCAGVLCTALIGCFCVQRGKDNGKPIPISATSPRSTSINSDVYNEGGMKTEMTSINEVVIQTDMPQDADVSDESAEAEEDFKKKLNADKDAD